MNSTYIRVHNRRAMVSRRAPGDTGTIIERATNWLDLEPQAKACLVNAHGQSHVPGDYECPMDLAGQAQFPRWEEWIPLSEALDLLLRHGFLITFEGLRHRITRGDLDVYYQTPTGSEKSRHRNMLVATNQIRAMMGHK